jgi:triacylglycerol esterase/lipase EstA (alpha/beta hydrolase family)
VDDTPANGRVAVVLIHGWTGGNPTWSNFVNTTGEDPTLAEKIKLFYFHYDSQFGHLAASEPQTVFDLLGDALHGAFESDTFDGGQVIIVAHSMGGLVARSMMKNYAFGTSTGASLASLLITLGTPHHGSPLANALDCLAELAQDTGAAVTGGFAHRFKFRSRPRSCGRNLLRP